MRLLCRLLALVAAGALCGCVGLSVPRTTIQGNLGGAPFAISSPKDSTLVGLRVTAGTNGLLSVVVERLECRMNPDVVSMSSRAQVDLVNAVSDGVTRAAAKAATAAAVP
ncbi:MAG TPA: hypothetical protein PKI20_13555 [Verrucomicrobiota bacterium]|nr:hypothetical protein [Verrucomicrobiota bacterium]HQL78701.1 hypothetical protein [Verrucomicrobiota bacterium]